MTFTVHRILNIWNRKVKYFGIKWEISVVVGYAILESSLDTINNPLPTQPPLIKFLLNPTLEKDSI
jgi:hypothetical protein